MNWFKQLRILVLRILVTQLKITGYNTKISKIKNKINKISTDHSKYITTQVFNKLTSENVSARLAQVYLASKIPDISDFVKMTDFDSKIIRFTSNKKEIQKLKVSQMIQKKS